MNIPDATRSERLFHRIYTVVESRRAAVSALVIIVTVAAATGLGYLHFDSNIEMMLPDKGSIQRTIGFLRNSSIADKAASPRPSAESFLYGAKR